MQGKQQFQMNYQKDYELFYFQHLYNMNKEHKIDYNQISDSFNEYKDIEFKTDAIWYQYLENILKWNKEIQYILDYWCWSGNFTKNLVKNHLKVVGIDISESLLKEAKNRIPDGNFIKIGNESEVNVLFKENYFDAVIFNYVLCEIDNKEKIHKILSQIYKILKNNWKVYIHNSNRDRSNWIDFNTYRNNLKKGLKEGDKIVCTLKDGNKTFDVYDYFYPQKSYLKMLNDAWFSDTSVKELYWSKNIWRWNEIKHSPCYIITWTKSKPTIPLIYLNQE